MILAKKKEPIATDAAGYTNVDLNGTSYQLIFDYDSIEKAEADTGIGLLFGVFEWANVPRVRAAAMLYALMLKAHPDITLREVTSLVTFKNVAAISNALVEAWLKNPLKNELAS